MFFYKYSTLSQEQISEKLGAQPLASSVSPVFEGFAGANVRVCLDGGTRLELRFTDASNVQVSENGGEAAACAYKAMKLREAVLLSFMLPGTFRGWNLVVETVSRRVTAFEVWFCGCRSCATFTYGLSCKRGRRRRHADSGDRLSPFPYLCRPARWKDNRRLYAAAGSRLKRRGTGLTGAPEL